ncbi:serine threonine- kinase [Chlorella sorokiniana]|uniref:Serine threonine-kinase n=1 Tax=Chlorella sorokiniana TaxID=3076 RepID=A0A2P6THY6_CHLSO|nr:serine threonine- kinase [Chlorella sorokiniana]|eukprot:PRW33901.1 serine threonine- kinase [Chlorella sorokiniana]
MTGAAVARAAALLLLLACAWAQGVGQAAAPSSATASERELLLSFKAGISNWPEAAAARGLVGWCDDGAACISVCSWSGVQCNLDSAFGQVTELHLACTGACTVPLRGALGGGLNLLPQLQVLDLAGNELGGTLPETWGEPGSFPALALLNLNNNQLTGPVVPDLWAVGPAFNQLLDMQMARNRFSGTFSEAWAATNTSFKWLMSMNWADNRLSGTLPLYVNGIITMSAVYLQNNQFTGPLPPDWGTQVYFYDGTVNSTQALEKLYLHGNQLTGSLPPEWGAPESFTVLTQLTLSDNPLGASLPIQWGDSPDSLPALRVLNLTNSSLSGSLPAWSTGLQSLESLYLAYNNLTGTIPASWLQLASLSTVQVQPGNTELCTGSLPVSAQFDLCSTTDVVCSSSSLAPDGPQCSASGGSSGSSFPVAAVAVPAAVVGAALLVAAAFFIVRRRRRAAVSSAAASSNADVSRFATAQELHQDLEQGMNFAGEALVLKPSPPSSAPRPFSSLPSSMGSKHDANASSGSGRLPQQASGSSGSAILPTQSSLLDILSDWHIDSTDIQIMKRPDGSLWRLGAGGFGTVFKALLHGVQPVAVKVLGGSAAPGSKDMSDAEWEHEIAVLRACRHMHVVQFLGVCFQEGRLLLVTEHLEGGNLTHNLRAGKVTWWRRGKKIALDVARALVYLHSKRVIHLDVKSANVLLTRDGTAKLGDVGLSKIMAGDYVSGVVGTLAWSAPELLLGEHCTTKSDLFSVGVLLWEICCNEVPVRGQLRPPLVPDECPQEVADIIDRCLSRNQDDRPTATELVELLQRAPGTPPEGLQVSSAAPRTAQSSGRLAWDQPRGMLSAQSAARVDAITGALHALGALARWATRKKVITSEHAGILLAYAAGAAVPPALYTCRRGWYVRRRVPIVASVRLALALCLAVPLPIPDAQPASPAAFLWHVMLSGHSVYLFLLAVGLELPLRLHAWVTAFQAACQLHLASGRCGLLPPHPNRPSNLFTGQAVGAATFQALGAALDWPFHMVAPGINMSFSNELAACWACTAWIQLVLSVVLPTALLLAGRNNIGTGGRHASSPLPSGQAAAAAEAAAILWVLLRGACGLLLER